MNAAPSKWLWPLRSRKVQVALATVVATVAAEWGVPVSDDAALAVVAVGAALILGIAHEDAARAAPARSG